MLQALKKSSSLDSRPILLSLSTDLSLTGEPASEWLVATREWIAVVGEEVREVRLSEAKSFRAYSTVGSGFLQAQIDGVWIDLLRYSKGLAPEFSRAAKRLQELKSKGDLRLDEVTVVERCPTCGAKLRYAGEVCLQCVDRSAVTKRVIELIHPHRWSTIFLFILLLGGILISLVPPKLQQYLVDEILAANERGKAEGFLGSLGVIVLGLALTRVIGAGIGQLKGMVSNRIGTKLTSRVRARLVEKLHELPIGFHDKNQVGLLASRVTQDTEALHGFLLQLTNGFLLQLLQFIGVGVMLFVINTKLAIYTLIPAPFLLGASIIYWKYIYPRHYRLHDSLSKQMTALIGMLSGIRVVKAFAQEDREIDRFGSANRNVHDSRLDVGDSSTTYGVVTSLVFGMGGLIVWYGGGIDVLDRRMTLGALMAFLAYLSMFYAPLSSLAQLTTWFSSFVTASARILELFDTPAEMSDPREPKQLPLDAGTIHFEDVTFSYDGHQPVLEEVSFEIPRGQMVGIVGKSGSGKTTMVNLICRFYDPQDGRVTIEGVDVRDVARRQLRARIGIVLQETFLFRGTIWENLVYGHVEATVEQVLTAAKAAHAHDFIMKMPFGYDTAVTERGANLSGGERQRIAIARALVYQPSILILDEATSNLDAESERSIQDALEEVARGRTTLMIAHRLSTLRHASRILVFERGRLVEDGSHLELLAKDGIYAKLVRLQSRLAVDGPIPDREPAPEKPKDPRSYTPRWLTPDGISFRRGSRGELTLGLDGDDFAGVAAVLAFPTQPGRWISIRHLKADGTETELGIIRDLGEWDDENRMLVEEALSRRYHLATIRAIDRIEASVGILTFHVQTDRGPAQFRMRWGPAQTVDYGKTGKVLTDLEDNQWLVRDIEALPKNQRWLFLRYIYW